MVKVEDGNDHSTSTTSEVWASTLDITRLVVVPFGDKTVALGANFKNEGGSDEVSDYHASIDWGDSKTSSGRIAKNLSGDGFVVLNEHRYGETGSYIVTLRIDAPNASTSQDVQVKVKEDVAISQSTVNDLQVNGQVVVSKHGKSALQIATFSDDDARKTSDYETSIDWGDGNTSQGSIVRTPFGTSFLVLGAHTYDKAGTYTVTLTIHDSDEKDVTMKQTITVSNNDQ
jgi:hypothetical protein